MKYGITAALLLAGLGAAAGANAQENEAGFYAGAGVGTFDVEIDTLDDIDETIDRYKSDDTAWKAFVGYRTNPYFAVELAYDAHGGARSRKKCAQSDVALQYIEASYAQGAKPPGQG